MGYTARPDRPPSLFLTPISYEGIAGMRLMANTGPVSTAWPTNNLAIYCPVIVHAPMVLLAAVIANGATVSGNVDIGLYREDLSKVVSTGSTAQAGTSTVQTIDITDTSIAKGRYYLALSVSTTVATVLATVTFSAPLGAAIGLAQEATALPLPATATPVLMASLLLPLFGFATRAVV